MPTRWETFPVQVRGGLVTDVSALQQGLNEPGTAARLINFENSTQGGYRRINGYTKFDSNVVPSVDNTTQLLGVGFLDGKVIVPREGSIYTSSGGGWTTLQTGRTQPNKVRYTLTNLDGTRNLLGTDGSNYPYTWDGTTFTEITGTTDVLATSHAKQFKDHIFYAKGGLVTFAAPFTFDDFAPANGSGSFRVDNDITGLIVFRQRMFIFTLTSIWVLDGDSSTDFALTSVSEDIGCIQPDTIQEVAGDVAFLGPDGVRLLGATDRIGDFSNQVCSRRIQPELVSFEEVYSTFSSTVVREKSQYRVFGFTDGRDRETTDSYIGTQFEAQNPASFAWSQVNGIKAYAVDSRYFNDQEYIVFVGDTEYVYRMEDGPSFDGQAIVGEYWTPRLSLSDPKLRKVFFKITQYYDPEESIVGSVSLNLDFNREGVIQPNAISLNSSGGGSVFGQAVFDTDLFASASNSFIESMLVGSGETGQFQFQYDGGDPFIIDTLLIEYQNKDRQ